MGRRRNLTWMASGLLLGSLLMAGLMTCVPPARVLQSLPEPMLARTLMAGSASAIVKSVRYRDNILLYAKPVPISETMCRVVQYQFTQQDSGGFPQTASRISEFYAILKAPDLSTTPVSGPAAPAPSGEEVFSAQATRACSEYRDFDHLVSDGSSMDIANAVLLLEIARRDVIEGRAGFSVECRDGPHGQPGASCDGPSYLRDLDLKQITGVYPARNGDAEVSYWIQAQNRVDEHPIITDFRISTLRSRNGDPHITAVTIDRNAY